MALTTTGRLHQTVFLEQERWPNLRIPSNVWIRAAFPALWTSRYVLHYIRRICISYRPCLFSSLLPASSHSDGFDLKRSTVRTRRLFGAAAACQEALITFGLNGVKHVCIVPETQTKNVWEELGGLTDFSIRWPVNTPKVLRRCSNKRTNRNKMLLHASRCEFWSIFGDFLDIKIQTCFLFLHWASETMDSRFENKVHI